MQLSAGYRKRCEINVESQHVVERDIIDCLESWLESKDTNIEISVGYGICFGAFAFLMAHIVLALF
ncbi:MAG: hypothetical protein K9L17_06190 [Clostridiales bacterium]|nr:hypothetical protein [Clostridiales bacterium]MCF8022260.1 hypothetical protein [Clostridiales bacterium]